MKNLLSVLMLFVISCLFLTTNYAQDSTSNGNSGEKNNIVMHRYVVERTFPNGLNIPVNDVGKDICSGVVSNNAEDQVTWIQSYVSKDKKKTFCIYDAPSAEAIQKAAKQNNLPVDNITEVTVLDPYFYK
jgi:Nickel responsive protein SCO4226-like